VISWKTLCLVGNGIDIQLGGNDFLNKWIIVRLLSDAKAGKYDDLFAFRNRRTSRLSEEMKLFRSF